MAKSESDDAKSKVIASAMVGTLFGSLALDISIISEATPAQCCGWFLTAWAVMFVIAMVTMD